MADEDRGEGDIEKFSAVDLERLYQKGGLETAMRISGKSLNLILGVTTYEPETWYVLTAHGVEKLR